LFSGILYLNCVYFQRYKKYLTRKTFKVRGMIHLFLSLTTSGYQIRRKRGGSQTFQRVWILGKFQLCCPFGLSSAILKKRMRYCHGYLCVEAVVVVVVVDVLHIIKFGNNSCLTVLYHDRKQTSKNQWYCMRTLTRYMYSQINYMDQWVLYVFTMDMCSVFCCNNMTV